MRTRRQAVGKERERKIRREKKNGTRPRGAHSSAQISRKRPPRTGENEKIKEKKETAQAVHTRGWASEHGCLLTQRSLCPLFSFSHCLLFLDAVICFWERGERHAGMRRLTDRAGAAFQRSRMQECGDTDGMPCRHTSLLVYSSSGRFPGRESRSWGKVLRSKTTAVVRTPARRLYTALNREHLAKRERTCVNVQERVLTLTYIERFSTELRGEGSD